MVITKNYLWALGVLIVIGGLLRFSALNRPFMAQDEILPAFTACYEPGYKWMVSFYSTGGMILFTAWLSALILTSLGTTMTEFWWVAPVATVGTLQIPMTFVLARRLGCRQSCALAAAAVMAVLPIHVMQSRLALSHEVLAVFWLSASSLALLYLFERPSLGRGLGASFFCGVYLVSHHYVVPFVAYFAAICASFARASRRSVLEAVSGGVYAFVRHGGLLFPILAAPVVAMSLAYTFVRRLPHPKPDLRLFDFINTLHQSAGGLVAIALLLMIPFGLARAKSRSPAFLFCTITGAAYLAPLFLSNSADDHDVSQYSMVGISFLVLAAALAIDSLTRARWQARLVVLASIAVWIVTLGITMETVFAGERSPFGVSLMKGAVQPDTGVKAAGFFLRRYAQPGMRILSVHEHLSRYGAAYYLHAGSGSNLYALNGNQDGGMRADLFDAVAADVDLIVVGRELVGTVAADARFEEAVVIRCDGKPCAWIFHRSGVEFPHQVVEASDYNHAFDTEYGPRSIPVLRPSPPAVGVASARRVDQLQAKFEAERSK